MATIRGIFFYEINTNMSSSEYYDNWNEYEDDAEYTKKLLNKLITVIYGKDNEQPIDYTYKLEPVSSLTMPREINNILNRNTDKFDRLTTQGYKLDFITGTFYKLSA
jgi:hypothetical protein